MGRLTGHFRRSAWLNPVPQEMWQYTASIRLMVEAMENRMFPLTLGGLDEMARELVR